MSYILGGRPEAQSCAPHLDGRIAALSFQSLGELWHGAIKDGWGDTKRRRLDDLIRRFVILSPDEETVRSWAELRAKSESAGLTKATADLWIAATAKRHSLPLLTGDRGFLSGLDIEVIDIRAQEGETL